MKDDSDLRVSVESVARPIIVVGATASLATSSTVSLIRELFTAHLVLQSIG